MSEPSESKPEAVEIDLNLRVRVSLFAIHDFDQVLKHGKELVDSVEKLRPLLEKTGAIAELVGAFVGRKKG